LGQRPGGVLDLDGQIEGHVRVASLLGVTTLTPPRQPPGPG
jgi:hypothetical protein